MKIKVIVNPKAGRRVVQRNLEVIMGRLLMDGSEINVTATQGFNDARNAAAELRPGQYDLIIACGGDGTVNEIVDGLMSSGIRIPIAILAAGTSNDFAVSLRLPQDPDNFCAMVRSGEYRPVDVGRANGYYFINVAAFGMFAEVAHKTEREAKGLLGRLAYYLKGLSVAPEQLLMDMPVQVKCNGWEEKMDIRLCLVCNSSSAAMIRNLFRHAEVSDGKFDVLMLKKKHLLRKGPELVPYITSGDVLKDPAIVYFQTDHIEISSLAPDDHIELDLDGEYRGRLPLTVDVLPGAIDLLMPSEQQQQAQFRPLLPNATPFFPWR